MVQKCEFIVSGRAKRGEPLLCGRAGFRRRISRQLANASAVLCAKHAQRMAGGGFQVEPLDPVGAQPARRVEVTGIDTSERPLPLFASEEQR